MEVLAGERSYWFTPMDASSAGGTIVLFHRARSFGRDTHGAVREGGDTRLASQISRINPSDQWGDRCRSQIALTSERLEGGRRVFIAGDAGAARCQGSVPSRPRVGSPEVRSAPLSPHLCKRPPWTFFVSRPTRTLGAPVSRDALREMLMSPGLHWPRRANDGLCTEPPPSALFCAIKFHKEV